MAEVEAAREIVARGTSADRQLQTFQKAVDAGADHQQALRLVVDGLITETLADCAPGLSWP